MTSATFNAITYANKLKHAGLKSEIADVQAEEMSNIINNNLTTKNDLKELELRMIIKFGAMLFIYSGLIISILSFILKH